MSRRILFACIGILAACGEKASPQLQVSLSPTSALQHPNAIYLVIIASSQPTNGYILDLDGDSIPDQFVFPSSCSPSGGACGFSLATASTLEVGYLPLDFNYDVVARLKDSSGATICQGSSTFLNDGSTTTLPITLVSCP